MLWLKTCIRILLTLSSLLLLSGCWDEVQVGEVNYVTTLGIDYEDDQYIIYAQVLDFSSVAKMEFGKIVEPAPLYIGKGTGNTMNDAIYDLYRTIQQKTNWAHVGAIIYSESLLEIGTQNVEESLLKSGEFRYTPWMFGTNESLESMLSITGFYQLPPIYTILYKPKDSFEMYSYIEPLQFHRFNALNKEPGGTALLPSLMIDKTDWMKSKQQPEPKQTLKVDGVYPVSDGKYSEWVSYDEMIGYRWIDSNTLYSPINISLPGGKKAAVRITSPSSSIQVNRSGGQFTFDISVKAKGTLIDSSDNLTAKEIEALVKEKK